MRSKVAVTFAFLFSPTAFAAVPVADAPREKTEKSISDCMKKARQSKDETLKPSKGITGSVKAPGTGAGQTPGGTKDVTGTSAEAGNKVGKLDVAPVMADGPQSVGGLSVKAAAQSVASSQAVSTALTESVSGFQSTGNSIGGLDPIQGAWNQNSLAKVGNGSLWNQAIQVSAMVSDLVTQSALRGVSSTSADAWVMTFDPALMMLAGPSPGQSVDNSQRSTWLTPSFGVVSRSLNQVQRQAGNGGLK